jgi:hypothetical protein
LLLVTEHIISTPVWDINPVDIVRNANAAGAGVGDGVLLPRGVAAAAFGSAINKYVAEEAQKRQQQLLQQAFCGDWALLFRVLRRHVAAVRVSTILWRN